MYNKKEKAFTLIELAIVIAIIGFILASLIASKKLIYKAKLDGIISDINKIKDAVNQFETKYGTLPGDLAIADQILLGATASVNGNGIIDSSAEALQFWYHLKLAGLLTYNFDGASANKYVAATYTNSGGIMAGSFNNSAYNVLIYNTTSKMYNDLGNNVIGSNLTNSKIIINLSFSPSSSYKTEILTPQDALYIDKKLDDGNPETGIIRSANGISISSPCVTSSQYNLSTSTPACYLQFLIDKTPQISYISTGNCVNGPFGSNTYQKPCPEGYRGYITQTCGKDGSLVTTENLCEAIKCSGDKSYKETTTIPCSNDTVGSMKLTCGLGGVYKISDKSTCDNSSSAKCYSINGFAEYNTCPIGYIGDATWSLMCYSGTLINGGSCISIICDVGNISLGDVTSSNDTSCPANYTYNNPNPLGADYSAVCILPLTVSSIGNVRPYKSYCVPNFGSCTTVGSKRTLSCPKSQTGSNTQICNNSGYWETQSNVSNNTTLRMSASRSPMISCQHITKIQHCTGAYHIGHGKANDKDEATSDEPSLSNHQHPDLICT
ncbi:MAG: type II secretion system protein [Sphingobacteriaceae bacterium]|nr:MAG: type II secretion system protein [Sphingobacteriaceae bacterium]